MAKANLRVDDSVLSAWHEANDAGDVRYVALSVVGETVSATGVHKVVPEEAEGSWWAALAGEAISSLEKQKAAPPAPAVPAFASPGGTAFRITPLMWLVSTDPAARSSGRFVLVSWTPEGVHPRAKMLYASARDDVKRALGASRFEPDYHVGEVSELNAGSFASWRVRDREDAMTSNELVQAETRKAVNSERAAAPRMVATMTKVPFRTEDALKEALASFAATGEGSGGASSSKGWVEIAVSSAGAATPGGPPPSPSSAAGPAETISLVARGEDVDASVLAERVAGASSSSHEPRFFLLTPSPPGNGAVVLIYHCPEGSKPKARMLYSTAKAAVTELASQLGVAVAKVVRLVGGTDGSQRGPTSTHTRAHPNLTPPRLPALPPSLLACYTFSPTLRSPRPVTRTT
jgi:hypothetical protein